MLVTFLVLIYALIAFSTAISLLINGVRPYKTLAWFLAIFTIPVGVNAEDATVHFDALIPEDLALVQRKLSEMDYPTIEDSNTFGKKAKSYVSCALGRFS